ncbi:MAG: hypothetical protein M3380_12390 [Chloroflexota bacterium]|nr:hypothetical protein [Chloroflexota bacterium]
MFQQQGMTAGTRREIAEAVAVQGALNITWIDRANARRSRQIQIAAQGTTTDRACHGKLRRRLLSCSPRRPRGPLAMTTFPAGSGYPATIAAACAEGGHAYAS